MGYGYIFDFKLIWKKIFEVNYSFTNVFIVLHIQFRNINMKNTALSFSLFPFLILVLPLLFIAEVLAYLWGMFWKMIELEQISQMWQKNTAAEKGLSIFSSPWLCNKVCILFSRNSCFLILLTVYAIHSFKFQWCYLKETNGATHWFN